MTSTLCTMCRDFKSCKMHLKLNLSWIRVLLIGGIVHFCTASPWRHSDNTDIKSQQFLHSKQEQFSRELSRYEISIPEKVTFSGEFLSHSVHHTRQALNHRTKRATNIEPNMESDKESESLHYKINVDSMELHIELEPNHKLLSPAFVVERRPKGFKDISYSKITAYPENRCHFTGHVKGHPGSKVALATCTGLHGYLHTQKGTYMIEPLEVHNTSGQHPHLVYHRSSLPPHLDITRAHTAHNASQHGACPVPDSYEETINEREAWQKDNRPRPRSAHHRNRRSVSAERYVETMVVVDKDMMEFYENEDIMTYVLTIMNMVSMLYHDSTIGNAVNVQLVHLILMDYDEENLKITHHADNTLRSFCKWQKSVNVKDDKEATHHDVAILLTRRNICAKMNEPCSTLGLSQVNGLCQPHRSCNINEDTGLSLAYTVSHELGHNFGMQHDGEGNTCHSVQGEYQLLMEAQLNAEASPMVWSTCSRAAVTKFLDRDWGFCLDDESAKHDFYLDERPPGVIYDAQHQCRLQYGDDADYCDVDNLCVTLWCQVKNKCMTRLEAAAEGTICGDNKWCSGGRCVPQGETPLATSGEWGEWGSWTGCSRSCGAGVTYRQRHCDNPPPKNGGKFCLGERKRYTTCSTDSCPEDTIEFKDLQCQEFNTKPYKGKLYDWEYVSNPRTPCQLHCRPKNQFFSVMLKDIVADGTACPIRGKNSMCISGLCRHVGCDWTIDSHAKEDHCGVCRGDGSRCKTVKTNFNKEQGMGYVEAMVIPQGARNIRIEEVAEANNYLAVRNDNGEYYLNGGWFIQWNGDYEAGGTVMTYERVGDKEMLKAPGPLKESLHIMLLFQSENPGVKFQYTIPNENATSDRKHQFRWIFLDWTHCTHSCGGGTQRSEVVCSESQDGLVDDRYCDESTRPEDMLRVCNDHPCPPRWWPGPWQHCSKTCGNDGVRRRTVLCVRSSGNDVQEALEDWQCEDEEKPIATQTCNHKPVCPPELTWTTGKWSVCTRTCGGGIQMRSVTCAVDSACADTKPVSQQECNQYQCQLAVSAKYEFPGSDSASPDHNDETDHFDDENYDDVENSNIYSSPETFYVKLDVESTNLRSGINNNSVHVENANEQSATVSTQTVHQFDNIESTKLTHIDEDNSQFETAHLSTDNVNPFSTQRMERTTPIHVTHKNNPRLDNVKGKVLDLFTKPNIVQDAPINYFDLTTTIKTSTATTTSTTTTRTTTTATPDFYTWVPLFWGECSKKCGGGIKSRPVRCFHNVTLEQVPEVNCEGQEIPRSEELCNTHACLEWHTTEWSKCSASCGEGTSHRVTSCPQSDACGVSIRPREQKPCNIRPCIDWHTHPWNECSVTCGGGQMTRKIECIDLTTNTTSSECNVQTRPSQGSRCSMIPCPQSNAASSGNRGMPYTCQADILSTHVCLSLQRMGRCWHNVVQFKCCRTCRVVPKLRNNNKMRRSSLRAKKKKKKTRRKPDRA